MSTPTLASAAIVGNTSQCKGCFIWPAVNSATEQIDILATDAKALFQLQAVDDLTVTKRILS